jgi:hemerythrin
VFSFEGGVVLDKLAIVREVMDEHQTIRGHIKLLEDSISDEEALTALENIRSDWIPGRLEDMPEKQKRLQQTLTLVQQGLKRHYAFEEEYLRPLFGDLIMEALVLEHRALSKEIGRARLIVANTKLEGLSREKLLSKESHIKEMIDSICQMKQEHLAKEEAILDMVQRALEARAKQLPIEVHS